MKTQWLRIVIGTMMVLNAVTPAFAQDSFSSKFKPSAGTGSTSLGGPRGRSAIIQQHIENKNKPDPALTWPPFPRVWIERTSSDSDTNGTASGVSGFGKGLSMGVFSLPGLSGHMKKSIEVKYTITTSTILISSVGSPSDSGLVVPGEEEIFLENRTGSSLVYPKVSKERPMVGLCYFEMTLNHDELKSKGIELMGSGISNQAGHHDMSKLSRFSNFFQVTGDVAVETYHFEECANRFRSEVEASVIKNFSLLILQMVNNTCAPGSKTQPNPEGDRSCMHWISTLPSVIGKSYVPRCEQKSNGDYHCVLKAKKGHLCPVYANRKTQEYSDKYDRNKFDLKIAGNNTTAIPCDTAMNQRCELLKEPTMLWGVPLKKGTARCQ